MKSIFTILLLAVALILLVTECDKISLKDPIEISDKSFLDALIEEGVDSNGDSLISYKEAEEIRVLNITSKGITDLKGIEFFVNLDTLVCKGIKLVQLDVSKNINLRYLDCSHNRLSHLDVSRNTLLNFLDCFDNELADLDVSNNTTLQLHILDQTGH